MAIPIFTYDNKIHRTLQFSAKLSIKIGESGGNISGSATFGLEDTTTVSPTITSDVFAVSSVPTNVSGSIDLSTSVLVNGRAYRPFIKQSLNSILEQPILDIGIDERSASGSIAGGDVYVNSMGVGPNDPDGNVFFYKSGDDEANHLKWANTNGRFEFSNNLAAAGNMYINQGGPDGDSNLYFYNNSLDTGAFLKFKDSENQFQLSHGLVTIFSPIRSGAELYVNAGGLDSSILYFYDSTETGQQLNYSSSKFNLSDKLQISTSGSIFDSLLVTDGLTAAGTVVIQDDLLNFGGDPDAYWQFTIGVMKTGKGILTEGNVLCEGDVYHNYGGPDGDSFAYFYDGSSPTGASLKFDNAATGFKFSNKLNMSSQKINAVADPTLDQDAATKIYVDTFLPAISVALFPNARPADWAFNSTDGYLKDTDTNVGGRDTFIYLNMPETATGVTLSGRISVTSI